MRENLIDRRKKLKLSQKEVADKIGVARSTYSAYETGKLNPKLNTAIKIKDVLKQKNNDKIFENTNTKKEEKNK